MARGRDVRHCGICHRAGHDRLAHEHNPGFFTKNGVVHPIREGKEYLVKADKKSWGGPYRERHNQQAKKGSPATRKVTSTAFPQLSKAEMRLTQLRTKESREGLKGREITELLRREAGAGKYIPRGHKDLDRRSADLLNALQREYDGRWPNGYPVGILKELRGLREAIHQSGERQAPQGSSLVEYAHKHAAKGI